MLASRVNVEAEDTLQHSTLNTTLLCRTPCHATSLVPKHVTLLTVRTIRGNSNLATMRRRRIRGPWTARGERFCPPFQSPHTSQAFWGPTLIPPCRLSSPGSREETSKPHPPSTANFFLFNGPVQPQSNTWSIRRWNHSAPQDAIEPFPLGRVLHTVMNSYSLSSGKRMDVPRVALTSSPPPSHICCCACDLWVVGHTHTHTHTLELSHFAHVLPDRGCQPLVSGVGPLIFMIVSGQWADESHRLPESSPARHQTFLNTCALCRRLCGCAWVPLSEMVDAVCHQISVRSPFRHGVQSGLAWPSRARRHVAGVWYTVQRSLRCIRPLSPSACRADAKHNLHDSARQRGRPQKSLVSAILRCLQRQDCMDEGGFSRSSHPAAPPDVLSLQCSLRLQRQLDKTSGPFPFGREARRRGLSVQIWSMNTATSRIRYLSSQQGMDSPNLETAARFNASATATLAVRHECSTSQHQCAEVHHQLQLSPSWVPGRASVIEARTDTLETPAVSG
ncbi:hypothetical protein B0T18DRAFT_103861 [Schizothecium vesticola]|uniref:Uncharacterized protein n=1 Tax=Schizothecium vesticola TaxID=314040 RepID=A0AA40K7Z6_9PEZI|nr:hypothetical protein B0T18DRAFT_103861 [Schizothecium vesticola]